VRAASPFGSRPGWGLAGVIVKSGDDCRQELMALQLIRELGDIWTGGAAVQLITPILQQEGQPKRRSNLKPMVVG
jgi:hypothetical protein